MALAKMEPMRLNVKGLSFAANGFWEPAGEDEEEEEEEEAEEVRGGARRCAGRRGALKPMLFVFS